MRCKTTIGFLIRILFKFYNEDILKKWVVIPGHTLKNVKYVSDIVLIVDTETMENPTAGTKKMREKQKTNLITRGHGHQLKMQITS